MCQFLQDQKRHFGVQNRHLNVNNTTQNAQNPAILKHPSPHLTPQRLILVPLAPQYKRQNALDYQHFSHYTLTTALHSALISNLRS